MLEPPSGTVTFLFTDIEGSTRLWEQYPDAMRDALAQHDTILRQAIHDNNGYIFKTMGDSFCAAFATAPEALRATLSAQLALHQEAWTRFLPLTLPEERNSPENESLPLPFVLRVRMALHTGTPQQREDDYFGPPLNRTARLRAAAHGGQTLLSQATFELLRDNLPERVHLINKGVYRLLDLKLPEQIYQLVIPELPADFPPLRSLDALPNNLPHQLTTFIGREQQIADVQELLRLHRLVTLTGSGGCGKTRLAIQVAAALLESYVDGVWLIDLAALTDPALVPNAIAAILSLPEEPGRPMLETLIDALRIRSLLLILDNCEHVVHATATLSAMLLQNCPDLRLMATSREALGVPGESVWRIPSLTFVDSGQPFSLADLQQSEACRLFVERVTAILPDFAVTEQNAPFVAQICQRLDGMPLALELAAARVRVLSVEQVAKRLDDRFRLLTGGSRTALPRQQTLRALIDWSYDLLSPRERTLLRRLAVFAGGWNLLAAEAICADREEAERGRAEAGERGTGRFLLVDGEPMAAQRTGIPARERLESWQALDTLMQLVDKSLVLSEGQGEEGRYRLQETMRQYGLERLFEARETETLRRRHRDHFLHLAEEAEPHLAAGKRIWFDRLETEHDNLRAALNWCESTPDGSEKGLRLAGALWWFWFGRGHYKEGSERLTAVLRTSEASSARLHARALLGAGAMAFGMGDFSRSGEYYRQALTLYQAENESVGMALALAGAGMQHTCQGEYPEALEKLEEGLRIARASGDRGPLGLLLLNLAETVWQMGDPERCEAICEECLALGQELRNPLWIAYALNGLGAVATFHGDYRQATELYTAGLSRFREMGDRRNIAYSLEGLAKLAVLEGYLLRGAKLFGAAAALREAIRSPLTPPDHRAYGPVLEKLQTTLDTTVLKSATQQGRLWTLEQAINYALTGPPES